MPNKIKQLQSLFKKIALVIYCQIKNLYKNKKGRSFKVNLLEQIVLTLFKLRYNLPDRILERLFNIDHVTISRIVLRISTFIAESKFNIKNNSLEYYIVDSTTIRIGKGKDKKIYSGYKHHHGIKDQLIINNNNQIEEVSKGYSGSVHDKKLFLKEYELIKDKIDKTLQILGDKAYIGLEEYKVTVPKRRKLNNSTSRVKIEYKKDKVVAKEKNKNLSSKRIKIEHVFAYMKNYRILTKSNHYSIAKIDIFFKAIANIFNLSKAIT